MSATLPLKNYRLALVQMTAGSHVQENLAQALHWIAEAKREKAALVALPEMFLYLGGHQGRLQAAVRPDHANDATMKCLRQAAVQHRIWLMLGSVPEYAPDQPQKVYNTTLLLAPDGQLCARYRKRHLFEIQLPNLSVREADYFLAGDVPSPVAETPLGRLGFSICFDLRYGEHYQQLRQQGAELVFVPSNFTVPTGQAHWEVLLRSQAIANQLFIAAPAQVGTHPTAPESHASYGHSMLVSPWGEVLCCKPKETGIVVREVDLTQVKKVRSRLPLHHTFPHN